MTVLLKITNHGVKINKTLWGVTVMVNVLNRPRCRGTCIGNVVFYLNRITNIRYLLHNTFTYKFWFLLATHRAVLIRSKFSLLPYTVWLIWFIKYFVDGFIIKTFYDFFFLENNNNNNKNNNNNMKTKLHPRSVLYYINLKIVKTSADYILRSVLWDQWWYSYNSEVISVLNFF